VAETYRTDDWKSYVMSRYEPFSELEPLEREAAVVDGALAALRDAGILPHADYDGDGLTAHRAAVRRLFEMAWTTVTPRVERLIYAINAIARPDVMVATGIFCGYTFMCNAGAAVGPGACYEARDLVGVEVRPGEAERAERNVRRMDGSGAARIVAEDALRFVETFEDPIDLLYLDAGAARDNQKAIYYDIVKAAYARMPAGALVLAHDSVRCVEAVGRYLEFVRDPANFRASVNVVLDGEGLEVSVK